MKKPLVLLLALLMAGMAACGGPESEATPTPVVTGYEIDVPDGFEQQELAGFDRCYMSADGSNINVNIQDKTGLDDNSFNTITAEMLRQSIQEGFQSTYELDVEITDIAFTQEPVGGFAAYQYEFSYDLMGMRVHQLSVSVNADKLYTFTYTDTTGDWMEQFLASAADIRFSTEAAGEAA